MDKSLSQITFEFFGKQKEEHSEESFPVQPRSVPAAPEQPKPRQTRGRKALKDFEAETEQIEIPEDEILFQKQYYSIGEVANMFKVNTSLIRYWENEFDIIEPRKNRKGDRFFREAQDAEIKKDWDTALQFYLQAVDEDPRDTGYLIGLQKARFQSANKHVERGQARRADGKLDEAITEFQKAIGADPSSALALQELKRTQDMLRRPTTTAEGRTLTPIEQFRRQTDQQVESMLGPPELKPAVRRIPTIKLNNQPPRVLYESIGKIAGITTVIDPDGLGQVQTRNFNVELGESTPEQAFDYVALLTHTYWKPISPTSIFIAQDTANKRRDYEDFVVKTFYITNASTVQEFQEISTAVRTITNITRVFTVNPQKALVVRGSADA